MQSAFACCDAGASHLLRELERTPWYESLVPARPQFAWGAGGGWAGAAAGADGRTSAPATGTPTPTPTSQTARDPGTVSLELLGLVSALLSALFSLLPSEWAAGRSHALLASVRHEKERKRDRSSTSSPAPARALLAVGTTY